MANLEAKVEQNFATKAAKTLVFCVTGFDNAIGLGNALKREDKPFHAALASLSYLVSFGMSAYAGYGVWLPVSIYLKQHPRVDPQGLAQYSTEILLLYAGSRLLHHIGDYFIREPARSQKPKRG